MDYLICPNCGNVEFSLSEAYRPAIKCKYCNTVFFNSDTHVPKRYTPTSHNETDGFVQTELEKRIQIIDQRYVNALSAINAKWAGARATIYSQRDVKPYSFKSFSKTFALIGFFLGVIILLVLETNFFLSLIVGGLIAGGSALLGLLVCWIDNAIRESFYERRGKQSLDLAEESMLKEKNELGIWYSQSINEVSADYQAVVKDGRERIERSKSTSIISHLIRDEIDLSLQCAYQDDYIQRQVVTFWVHIHGEHLNIWSSQHINEAAVIQQSDVELSRRCVILNEINIAPLFGQFHGKTIGKIEWCDALAIILAKTIKENSFGPAGAQWNVQTALKGSMICVHLSRDNPNRTAFHVWQ